MTLAEQIRALQLGLPVGGTAHAALDRAAALADEHAATQLSNDERLEYQQALIWCSAAADFAPEGQARKGWLKLCKPLIDRQPIEGASRDNWNAWLDDLPLPEGFEEGIAALQRFIAGLPAEEHAAATAAAYEACPRCSGSWMVVGYGGDPALCPECRGDTVVPANPCEALVAAAYEDVACRFDEAEAEDIRARTPADARAALDRIKRDAVKEALSDFSKADWFWRDLDPDDCGDTPNEAINAGIIGCFTVCHIRSSFTGPDRFCFIAPVLDPESDEEECLCFATQEEAIAAAKERRTILAAVKEAGNE